MYASARVGLLLAAAALGGAAFLAACDDGDDDGGAPEATATAETGAPEDASPEAVSTIAGGAVTFEAIGGAMEGAVDIEAFLPETIRIRAGDTVRWTAHGHEEHTVTFVPDDDIDVFGDYLVPAADADGALEFNPSWAVPSADQGPYDGTSIITSGFFGVPAEQSYSLTFSEPGVYTYICMVHALHMRGIVVVEEEGTEVPSPDWVAAEAARERDEIAADALAQAEAVQDQMLEMSEAGGRKVHPVATGFDTPKTQVLSFLPGSLEINAGETVVFRNSDRDFHNVIFAPEGMEAPQFPLILPGGETGGFRVAINPDSVEQVDPPDGFGPDDYFSSGMMGVTWPRFQWAVTFETPGTYRYVCTVHTLAGMAGVITVVE